MDNNAFGGLRLGRVSADCRNPVLSVQNYKIVGGSSATLPRCPKPRLKGEGEREACTWIVRSHLTIGVTRPCEA